MELTEMTKGAAGNIGFGKSGADGITMNICNVLFSFSSSRRNTIGLLFLTSPFVTILGFGSRLTEYYFPTFAKPCSLAAIFMKQILKTTSRLLPYAAIILTVAFLSIYSFKTFDKNIKTFDSIATGIISGLVTALLILVFQILWKKNINVWLENLLYQDVCIEGEWTGYLVPHLGIKDLDRIQRQMAYRIFKERNQKEKQDKNEDRQNARNSNTVVDTEAEEVSTNENDQQLNGKDNVKAEIILHHPSTTKKDSTNQDNQQEKRQKTIVVETTIKLKPITVRFEIKRTGHKIFGRLIEVAGVNQINSYNIDGLFKNLILSGTYETFNKENMDRGAFSLMLVDNGKKLEGFFSVYNDDDHKIMPLQCVLKKQNKLNDNSEVGD